MRAIWIILLLLIAAGGAALWSHLHAPVDDGATAPSSTGQANGPTAPTTADGAKALVDDLLASSAARTDDANSATVAARPSSDRATAGGAAVAAAPASGAIEGSAPSTPGANSAGDAPSQPLSLGLDARIAGATIVPGTLVRVADGSIRADDRFTIRGAGTADDPYRISWELLTSASETFQPRLGQMQIPQRIAMLDHAHVRIEGYAAFPAYSFDPTEMLMMLNQWDGCCIGVPPTPYDAIEVKLAAAPREHRRQATYFGSVHGELSVEPYLVENWLVGLYVMSGARFSLEM